MKLFLFVFKVRHGSEPFDIEVKTVGNTFDEAYARTARARNGLDLEIVSWSVQRTRVTAGGK